MKYRKLGRTKLKVSEIGFGCWAIGGSGYGPTSDEQSLEALETAFARGINFFDTADTYGHGHSEELIAQFLKGKTRSQIVIASKVGWDFYQGGNRKNFSTDYIPFACEQTLKRLGIEVLDLYQLHNPSLEVIKNGEVISSLEKLKQEGKIRFIGVSVHTEEEALECIKDGRIDALQVLFNLLDQRMAGRVFEEAKKNNIGVVIREPLACGLLTGKYQADHVFAKDDHRRRWTPEKLRLDLEKINMIKTILTTRRLSLSRAALEYTLEFEEVSSVIPGAKTKEQVVENIQASDNPLLRIEESSHLRNLYYREPIFQQF